MNFLDTITSNLLVPHIIHPTRITSISKTLIVIIYSNSLIFKDGISGNLTLAISDHLTQFLKIQGDAYKTPVNCNQYIRDFKNIDRENVLLDHLALNWNIVISIDKNNPNESFNLFVNEIDTPVNQYIPLRKLDRSEIKGNLKPWIAIGIRNSMIRRDKIYKIC